MSEHQPFQLRPQLFWVYGLTLIGGFFNGGAILLHQRPASHHTGNVSGLALELLGQKSGLVAQIGGVMLAFLLGSVVAGFLFYDRQFKPVKRYGLTQIAMGIILGAALVLPVPRSALLYFGAALMGLQNGLFIFYRSILVRTTHVTGTLTDLGFALGSLLRGNREELPKVFYYSCSILTFFGGSLLSVPALHYGEGVFWCILCVAYILVGIYYFYLRSGHHIRM